MSPRKIVTLSLLILSLAVVSFIIFKGMNKDISTAATSADAAKLKTKEQAGKDCGKNQTYRNGKCVYTYQIENKAKSTERTPKPTSNNLNSLPYCYRYNTPISCYKYPAKFTEHCRNSSGDSLYCCPGGTKVFVTSNGCEKIKN